MFEHYKKKFNEFVKIPLPAGKEELYLTEDGQVLSLSNGYLPVGYNAEGFRTVTADLWKGRKEYSVALIALVTFDKLKLQTQYFSLVEPFHRDGNKNNLHPSNLGYRYKEPIECEVMPGFYYIPFFNSYVINREGEVRNWVSGKSVKFSKTSPNKVTKVKGGYLQTGLRSDVGQMRTSQHRLLALTFIPYPDNVDKLDVNHIDGNPSNNELSNLEFVTRRRNIVHSFEIGLHSQNVRIFGKNVFTGEEREFYSVNEAMRRTGSDAAVIAKRLTDRKQSICAKGWLFKKDAKVPWRKVRDPLAELKRMSSPTCMFSKNVFTGVIRKHTSMTKAAEDLSLPSSMGVKHQIDTGRDRPYFGYVFRIKGDSTPWPEFTERQLAVFRDSPCGRARGVIARNDEGKELFFTNIKKAAEHFRQTVKSKNDIIKAIARKRRLEGFTLTYYEV